MNVNSVLELCQRYVRYQDVDYAPNYGEPGYSDPETGILFANWNDCPKWLIAGLERRGYELEWKDEWIIAHETGKAFRTEPDSYSWKPYYVISEDSGEVIGGDEIESGDELEWYINEYLLNDPTKCNLFDIDLASQGFEQFGGRYETGWHPGQNDSPPKVFERIQRERPDYDVVFSLDSKGQFDTEWSAWIRSQNRD